MHTLRCRKTERRAFGCRLLLAGLSAGLALAGALSGRSWAGGQVTECSEAALRAAVLGGGPVTFDCDGVITLASTITNSVDATLDGTGHHVTISGGNAVRVFAVGSNATLTLVNLAVANGLAASGGGLLNSGGSVKATNCVFSDNCASGGRGGGIDNESGTVFLDQCSFTGNLASGAPGTWQPGMTMGGSGWGGAIFNNDTLRAQRTTFVGNVATGGAGGPGGNGIPWMDMATDGGPGGPGGQGAGGGWFNLGTASAVNCTFFGNSGVGGAGGTGGTGGTGQLIGGNGGVGGYGGAGMGGAICDTNGQLYLTNCTVAGNVVSGGSGGAGGSAGGHAYVGGWDGNPGPAGAGGGGLGSGLNSSGGTLINTLLANFGNCAGWLTDAGHNLSSDATCAFTNTGSLNRTDPKLGPFGGNGGPTPTMALLPSSPAIDAGDSAAAPAIDQRGFPRPAGAAADIGAFEYGARRTLQIAAPSAGVIDIALAEMTKPSCRLLTSADFVNWWPIATNSIGADGSTLFHLQVSTNEPRRFYRVCLP